MKLSELKTGEHGVIVKVQGHGGFRKRIIEMGFIKGKDVEVSLNAPLQDPVIYKLMGYEISLRRQDTGNDRGGGAASDRRYRRPAVLVSDKGALWRSADQTEGCHQSGIGG